MKELAREARRETNRPDPLHLHDPLDQSFFSLLRVLRDSVVNFRLVGGAAIRDGETAALPPPPCSSRC
jgi:hypothetical protein